eukprot:3294094-Amphidinium_carterae.1
MEHLVKLTESLHLAGDEGLIYEDFLQAGADAALPISMILSQITLCGVVRGASPASRARDTFGS